MFELILVETPAEGVGLIRFNRPKQYNALNSQLLTELAQALESFEQDSSIRSVIITGSKKAFAAGADIAEMLGKSGQQMHDMITNIKGWNAIANFSKPTICAVSGMALGGGFELALQSDILIAAEGAKFALPEVNLGVIPGAGGTQLITRLVGKPIAMEMVMNARPLLADEALQRGVVSRVVAIDQIEEEALTLAKEIAARPPLATQAGKNCVNKAVMSTLEEGLMVEKEAFSPLFDSSDAQRLMSAFIHKSK